MVTVFLGSLMMWGVLAGSLVSLAKERPAALALVVLMLTGCIAGTLIARPAARRHNT